MAVAFPAGLDPDEELWLPVNWAEPLNTATNERLTSALFELSSEAITDEMSILAQDYSNTAARVKLTGGVGGITYDVLHTITTTDDNADTQKRQRTCQITVAEK